MASDKKINIVQEKSYAFALRMIKLHKYLIENKQYEVAKQVVRSGTSIGANIEEALGGHSERDFYYKMSISHKEARETRYWIRLLRDSEILKPNEAKSLLVDIEELVKLLSSITLSLKQKIEK
ncbi:four helix bundle protein [bacterium]|nr:four helix bundle protein [bacterium]